MKSGRLSAQRWVKVSGLLVCAILTFYLISCSCDDSSGDPAQDPPIAVVVLPRSATVTMGPSSVGTQPFRAYAFYNVKPRLDGWTGGGADAAPEGGTDVTDKVTWDVKDFTLGSFSGSTFRTEYNKNWVNTIASRGGATTVSATLDKVAGTANVTVVYKQLITGTGVPSNPDKLFVGPRTSVYKPTVIYPSSGVMLPPNLGKLEIQWNAGQSNDVYRVHFSSSVLDMTVYTKNRFYALDKTTWDSVVAAHKDGQVTYTVSGANSAKPGQWGRADARTILVANTEIKGGLYYWNASISGGIWKYDFAKPADVAKPFYTTLDAGACIGCHTFTRRGDLMAMSKGAGMGAMLDVKTRKEKKVSYKATLQSFSPGGSELLTVSAGVITRRDASTGKALGTIPTGAARGSHPDWSPDGKRLAYVTTAAGDYENPTKLKNASLHLSVQKADGSFGAGDVLFKASGGKSYYYPHFSPDGKWLLFNQTTGGTYSSPNANIFVYQLSNKKSVALSAINGTKQSNSWPRWSPFLAYYKSKKIYWITFSSIRNYGNRLKQPKDPVNATPQIWMAAFDIEKAESGKDPAYPAFWLPFQSVKNHNHVAQWTERIAE